MSVRLMPLAFFAIYSKIFFLEFWDPLQQEQEQERSPGYILPTPLQFIYTTRVLGPFTNKMKNFTYEVLGIKIG